MTFSFVGDVLMQRMDAETLCKIARGNIISSPTRLQAVKEKKANV